MSVGVSLNVEGGRRQNCGAALRHMYEDETDLLLGKIAQLKHKKQKMIWLRGLLHYSYPFFFAAVADLFAPLPEVFSSSGICHDIGALAFLCFRNSSHI